MAAIDMRADLSLLLDAVVSGNIDQIIAAAREYLQQEKTADVLIGRIGMIAAHGDREGHRIVTLSATSMLGRYLHWLPAAVDAQEPAKELALPLFVQGLKVAAPILAAGRKAQAEAQYPHPFFPSELVDSDKNVSQVLREAVAQNNAEMVERMLFGFYGTGADYRTLQLHTYEAIADTFQDSGHPLIYSVRGYQLLDAVEWGDRAANIIHWLAPHLPLRPNNDEPEWIKTVRSFIADPAHSVASVRTRLSTPKNENALSLRKLILSDADTEQVCQGVYDALIRGEASPRAIGSVIALAAADLITRVGDDDRKLFVRAAHGLIFASATRLVFRQVQAVEVLGLLFTAGAYVNALQKAIPVQQPVTLKGTGNAGGGLIAASQLETLDEQLRKQDLAGTFATAQRFLKIGHDPRALFGAIGLAAARVDAESDQGHTLQITQAASEEYLAWPRDLVGTNVEVLIQVALRAALFGKRDEIVAEL